MKTLTRGRAKKLPKDFSKKANFMHHSNRKFAPCLRYKGMEVKILK